MNLPYICRWQTGVGRPRAEGLGRTSWARALKRVSSAALVLLAFEAPAVLGVQGPGSIDKIKPKKGTIDSIPGRKKHQPPKPKLPPKPKPPPSDQEVAARLYREGLKLLARKPPQWRPAAQKFREAIDRDDTARYEAKLGEASEGLQNWKEAADAYGKAGALDRSEPAFPARQAQALLKLQQWKEAAAALEEAARREDRSGVKASYYASQGNALKAQLDWTGAAAAYQKATDLARNNAGYFAELGQALGKLQRWTDAAARLRRATELDGERSFYHYSLGDALSELKQWEEAEAAYQRAVDLDRLKPLYRERLGQVQFFRQKYREAAENCRIAAENDSERDEYWVLLGDCYYALNDGAKAAAAYGKAVALRRTEVYLNKLGKAYLALKKWEEAITAFTDAVKIVPANPEYQANLGDAYSGAKKWVEAEQHYREAATRGGDNPEYQYRLGFALLEQARLRKKKEAYEPAVAALQKAADLRPDDSTFNHALGNALFGAERYPEAEAAFRRALQHPPPPPADGLIHADLAGALYMQVGKQMEKLTEAREHARIARERGITNHWVYPYL
jgi:tetratricopeptide (TPR) repeat protein